MDDRFRIFRSMVLVSLFVFVGRIFGALREMVLAAYYGTSETIDAYLLVSNLAGWPVAVWLSILTVIAVPLFVRNDKEAPGEVQQFIAELLVAAVAIGAIAAVAFSLCVPQIASSGVLGLSDHSVRLVHEMAGVLSLLLPLGLLVGVLSVRLLSSERHINTLLEGVPALLVTVAVLLIPTGELSPLIWGTVVGGTAHAIALALFLPRSAARPVLKLTFQSTLWGPFLKGMGLFGLGQLIVGATGVIDQMMVAGLGTGAIAVLGYANRVLALLLGVGATAVARATLPTFSYLSVDDDERLTRSAKFWMKLLFILGLGCVPIGWVFAPWVVQLLFERGMFTPENTAAVSTVLRFGLWQLPFYFSGIVAVQVLAARGRYNQITQVGLINFAVKIVANLLLVKVLGVAGVMLATAVMYAVALVLLWKLAFVSSK